MEATPTRMAVGIEVEFAYPPQTWVTIDCIEIHQPSRETQSSATSVGILAQFATVTTTKCDRVGLVHVGVMSDLVKILIGYTVAVVRLVLTMILAMVVVAMAMQWLQMAMVGLFQWVPVGVA
jgi:hypothetical protein